MQINRQRQIENGAIRLFRDYRSKTNIIRVINVFAVILPKFIVNRMKSKKTKDAVDFYCAIIESLLSSILLYKFFDTFDILQQIIWRYLDTKAAEQMASEVVNKIHIQRQSYEQRRILQAEYYNRIADIQLSDLYPELLNQNQ
jgi:hypothetical protein